MTGIRSAGLFLSVCNAAILSFIFYLIVIQRIVVVNLLIVVFGYRFMTYTMRKVIKKQGIEPIFLKNFYC